MNMVSFSLKKVEQRHQISQQFVMRRREQRHEFFVSVSGFGSYFLIRHENDVSVAAAVDPNREFI